MKSVLKFVSVFALLIAIGIGIVYLFEFLKWRTSDDYTTQKYFNDLSDAYRHDAYGAPTPEETLHLFTAALKSGDTALASKYFVIEKQTREWISTIKAIETLSLR